MYSGPILTVHRTQASFMHRVSLNYHQRWSDIFYPFENYMTDLSISPYSNKNKGAINARICLGSANFAHQVFFSKLQKYLRLYLQYQFLVGVLKPPRLLWWRGLEQVTPCRNHGFHA